MRTDKRIRQASQLGFQLVDPVLGLFNPYLQFCPNAGVAGRLELTRGFGQDLLLVLEGSLEGNASSVKLNGAGNYGLSTA